MHRTWSSLAGCALLGIAVGVGPARTARGAPPDGTPAPAAPAVATGETLLLQDPTVSATHVVFTHAQDLWIAPRTGGDARRLTSAPGIEATPRLSPDGSRVAFTGQYEGNTDVYVMSIDGGLPTRLTWHPGTDRVLGWHPDGKRILFASGRDAGRPVERLYLVPAAGGVPEELPIPTAYHAVIGGGGGQIAYTPYPDAFRTWKRYRGGRTTPIWIFDPATSDVTPVPHDVGSDSYPAWFDGTVYFASDRGGVMNLYRWMPKDPAVERLTDYRDFDVRNVSAGGGVICFEQGGAIHLFDPAARTDTRLSISVKTDGLARQPRWESAKGWVRSGAPSPQGQRAVFEVRGEIVTVPREHGDARNLSNSPGANDRDPVWSPDGKRIAWLTDATGEYTLRVVDSKGRESPRDYALHGAGFYHDPHWSPDGKRILFTDRANSIAFVTLETGAVTTVATNSGTLGTFGPSAEWSPDSKWIAYDKKDAATLFDHVELFEVATSKVTRLTDAIGDADSPVFSRDGKLLFFRASTDGGPRQFGLDMSATAARRSTSSLYVVVLKKDGKNPLAPRSDEGDDKGEKVRPAGGMDGDKPPEKGEGKPADKDGKPADKDDKPAMSDGEKGDDGDGSDAPGKTDAKSDAKADAKAEKGPSIDVEGLDQRILALPLPAGGYSALGTVKDALLFLERGEDGPATLKSFDFEERKAKELLRGVNSWAPTWDAKHLLVNVSGAWSITDASAKNEKKLDVDSVRVRVEPEAEWKQTLREVWRIQRDYFYDPKMHGVDWNAMWERWSPFLAHVHHRADLNLVIGEMMGELSCGHEYVSGGQMPSGPASAGVGMLGADFEVADGRFRIKRILKGQNWNPGLRAPLTEPGVDARVGDWLVSVDGRGVKADREIFAAFEATADRQVELGLATKADGSDVRKVTVLTTGGDGELRRRDWIEANRERVTRMSAGRLAYVYMPDTGPAGLAAFDRDFYAQLGKQGLVLDERYNGGGKIADHVISVLRRRILCYWRTRDTGWLGRTPFGTLEGPMVMLINERAGSGGDAMPWMFKKLEVGTLVGTRTWGGLVGISGYPELMDGGGVTSAAFGIQDTDGRWVVENEGVAPDVEVVETPKDFIAGRDAQLERAVEIALAELVAHPPKPPPTYESPRPR